MLLIPFTAFSQEPVKNEQDSVKGKTGLHETIRNSEQHVRPWIIGGASVIGYGGSLALFSKAWYENYSRSSFHTFNDAGEWMQMDKIGHAWGAYNTSRITTNMWRWAGVKKNRAVALGTGSSLLYLLSIEYLDGRSADWGWSWADVGADIFGASLFAIQEIGWKEQKIQLKFSGHRSSYKPATLELRADELFGKTLPERLLKDYNAQTYWLGFNIKSLFPQSRIPAWLNIAVGYGAKGMFGGYENLAKDKDGNIRFDRRDIKRYRQWYLSPDIDLTKIKTNNKLLRAVFSTLNVLKIPAPAIEFSNNKFKLRALAF